MRTDPAVVDEKIGEAVEEVLERMFFTGLECSGTGESLNAEDGFDVEVSFHGPLSGAFRLNINEQTASSLGATLTCSEAEEFTHAGCVEVAGELANMFCGCLLSKLEPEANMTLDTPREGTSPGDRGPAIVRWFQIPEGALAIEFALDRVPREITS